MSFTPRLQKNILQSILLIVCLLSPSQAFSSSFSYTIADGWIKLTTPISSFYCKAKPTIGMPFVIGNKRNLITTFGLVGSIHYFNVLADKYSFHDNILLSIATFSNEESQRNLNFAYIGGRYFLPYSVFTYDIPFENAYYWARHSDACSVLLYGYSWFINIPAKIMNEIDGLLVLDRSRHRDPGTAEIASLASHKFACFIDILLNIVSLVVEIPIAIANTVTGVLVAFIAHPWNSICSILGLIYFGILSTIFAIWDVLANIVLIPYHFIF